MMTHGDIKNPTIRKVLNRGFVPVTWHNENQIVSGWLIKQGPKWVQFNSPSTGRKRIPVTELKHMKVLS